MREDHSVMRVNDETKQRQQTARCTLLEWEGMVEVRWSRIVKNLRLDPFSCSFAKGTAFVNV
jgi:hypothetical protein